MFDGGETSSEPVLDRDERGRYLSYLIIDNVSQVSLEPEHKGDYRGRGRYPNIVLFYYWNIKISKIGVNSKKDYSSILKTYLTFKFNSKYFKTK